MRSSTVLAAAVVLESASIALAQPVHVSFASVVTNGGSQLYSAGLSIDPYNPFGLNAYLLYGSTRLISPSGVAGVVSEDFYGPSWRTTAPTRDAAAASLNGRWTMEYEDFSGFRTNYFFDVAISGIDANDLAPLIITSPSPGSVISRTPTFFYESQFTDPDYGAGIIIQTLDVQRASDGRVAFNTPLYDGVYDVALTLSRSHIDDELFTITNAGYSGYPYLALNFTPGPLTLYSNASVTGLVVPAPGAAAMLGLGGLLAARRRR